MSKRRVFKHEGVADTRAAYADAKHEVRSVQVRNILRYRRRARYFLKNNEFDFQLYRGSDKYPRVEKITAVEAGKRNKGLVQSFVKAMDEGKESTLWAWRVVDRKAFSEAKRKHILDNNLEAPHGTK